MKHLAVVYAFAIVQMAGSLGMNSSQRLPVSDTERNLMNTLLTNYNVNVRPVSSSKQPVIVDFDVKVSKLVKLDIKEQQMIANTRIMMRWMDPNLVWNSSDYNHTYNLNIPSSLVWTPDILLHNTAVQDSQGRSDVYKAQVYAQSNGIVVWMSLVTVKSSCSLNIKWFPFDEQLCELNFGSISYPKNKLQLKFYKQPKRFSEMQANFHYSSGLWEMLEMKSQIIDELYECCMTPFSLIKYTLQWKRLSLYWLLYLVGPCLCLSFIALFTFFIPAGSGERTGFGITAVLSMSVYLLVISDRLPEKSDQSPLIGVLYVLLFFLMVGVLLSVIITAHISMKKTKPPACLKRLLKLEESVDKTPVTVIKNGVGSAAEEEMKEIDKRQGSTNLSFTNQVANAKEEGKEKWQEQWQEIAEKIDHGLFWVFLALTLICPSIVLIAYYV